MTINNLTELQRLMEDFCIWHKSKYKGPPDFKRVPKYLKDKNVSICQDDKISIDRAKMYGRHQHYLGTQRKDLVELEDWAIDDLSQ